MEPSSQSLSASLDFLRTHFQYSTIFCVFCIDISTEKAEKMLRVSEIIELFAQKTELYDHFSVYLFNRNLETLIPIEDFSKKLPSLSKVNVKGSSTSLLTCFMSLTEVIKDFCKLNWRNKDSSRPSFRVYAFSDCEPGNLDSPSEIEAIKQMVDEVYADSFEICFNLFGMSSSQQQTPAHIAFERHLTHYGFYTLKNSIDLMMDDALELIELDKVIRGAEKNLCDIFNRDIVSREITEYAEELDKTEKRAGKVFIEIDNNINAVFSEDHPAILVDETQRKEFFIEVLRLREELEKEVIRKLESSRKKAWNKLNADVEKIEEEFKRISNVKLIQSKKAYNVRVLKLWSRAKDDLDQIRKEILKKERFFDEKMEKVSRIETRFLIADNAGIFI